VAASSGRLDVLGNLLAVDRARRNSDELRVVKRDMGHPKGAILLICPNANSGQK
jgi:hypothetical protein